VKIFLHYLLVFFNILAISTLLFSYLSVYISPETFWYFAFLGLGYPYILAVNLIFVAYWLLRRQWKLFIASFTLVLLGWVNIQNTIQIDFSENASNPADSSIKLLTYNVRLFNLYDWDHNKEIRNQIFDFISNEKPEILCFQEFYTDQTGDFATFDTLLKIQKAKYSHVAYTDHVHNVYHFGIATFSSYPIINKGELRFDKSSNICIFTDMIIDRDTVRLYNNHLESFRFGKDNYEFVDSLKFEIEEKQISGAKSLIRKMRDAYLKRAKQADIIAEHIKNCPYPIIVCGDFNDTPVSYAYHKIRGDLKDSFVESGNGLGNTYVSKFPTFRIDNILFSDRFTSSNYRSPSVKYSDHYPVLCNLKLSK